MNKSVIEDARLLELLKAEDTLNALDAAGVDNWSGYGDHIDFENEELQNSFGISPNYPIRGVKPYETR